MRMKAGRRARVGKERVRLSCGMRAASRASSERRGPRGVLGPVLPGPGGTRFSMASTRRAKEATVLAT